MSEVHTWNVAAASNNSAPPDGAPENMSYAQVNNTMREMFASIKRWHDDLGGALTTGGTANAITITPNVTYASYFNGLRISFTAGLTNTGATTLNLGGLGAVELRGYNDVALTGGEIVAGRIYDVIHNGTRWNLSAPERSFGALASLDTINNAQWSGTDLAVANGGTGASDAAGARSNLGLGALATLGSINNSNWSGTDLAIANGGTGASDASTALTNLGVSTFAKTILDDTSAAAVRATIGAGTGSGNGDMVGSNNLSDLTNDATARTNLGLGALATLGSINNGNWSGTDLSVANGGTGSSTASGARSNLGLGSLATLSSINNANWSGTDLAVANGGTGASDAATARTNLGAYGSGSSAVFTSVTGRAGIHTSVSGTLVEATHLRGDVVQVNGNITLPTAAGGCNSAIVGDGSARTITRGSGLTMYVNGTNVASATLSARGTAGVVYTASNACYVTGDVT